MTTNKPDSWWIVIKAGSDQGTVISSVSKPTGYASVLGPFKTKTDAEKLAGLKPTTIKQHEVGGGTTINDLLSALSQANTWLRVGEVVIGLILIAVGVAKLTNAVPLATKIAGIVK